MRGVDRLAQRRGRRVDPPVRGRCPARPRRATRHRRGSALRRSPPPEPARRRRRRRRKRPSSEPESRRRRTPPSEPQRRAFTGAQNRRRGRRRTSCRAAPEPPEPTRSPEPAAGATRPALDPSGGRALSFPGAEWVHLRYGPARRADVAQLVEQRFCKPQVPGSSPVVGSSAHPSGGRIHHEAAVSIRCRRHSG